MLSADFSTETMQAKREWQYIFEVLNVKSLQAEILYTARLSFRRIKMFFRQAKTCPNRNIERQSLNREEDIARRESIGQ